MRKSAATLSRWLAVVLLLLVAPLVNAPAQESSGLVLRYRIIELPAEDGGQSRAYALNNTGQIVGWVESQNVRHSAHWHNRVGTDAHGTVHFELLHPYPWFDQNYSEAYDISDADQIVGTARTTIKRQGQEIVITNAYVLRPAVLSDLATPYPGDALTNLGTLGDPNNAFDSAATGVSNRSHVVGWADRTDRVMHAFLVVPTDGRFFRDDDGDAVNDLMHDLGTLSPGADPVSAATAVNDRGQITGYSYTITAAGKAAYRAFLITPLDTNNDGVGDLWFSGINSVNDLMIDIGTLGGTNSWGRDINNNAEIVGETDYDAPSGAHYTRAFHWKDGTMTDLGTLRSDRTIGFSAASAINDKGVIVGWAENDAGQRRAFVYLAGQMQDLNDLLYLVDEEGYAVTPTIDLTEARDVNEDGVIVGWGTIHGTSGTQTRGFLLNPVFVDQKALEEADPNKPQATPRPTQRGPQYSSEFVYGPPAADTTATPPADTNMPTDEAPALNFCAPASWGSLPLTLAGLIALRARRRPGQHPI